MFQKEHRAEWIVFVVIIIVLSMLYGFDIKEMFKRILEWGLALIGFKLLIDYGLIQRLQRL